ncbi:MAG: hypothetical protein DYH05_06615 [Acidobacteria bacterium ACB1]|nr:hypothetical protein [Pyrinomonadaceae bacterium]MCE7962159.1 hypothetical protein [Acidobacteria bacterium ACB1]RIJ92725.1 MAG: hypothetical protein DCC44_07675 [Acidobacteriota bacterium]
MRSILTLALIAFAFSFCGLQDKLKKATESAPSANANSTTPKSSDSPSSSSDIAEAEPSAAQKAIIDAGTETKWDDQGLAWRLPAGWKKMDVKKESFNYQSGNGAFLLVNISVMPDSFPMDVSLDAYYEQALQQMKNGKYEYAKKVTIDGIPGVEFSEAATEGKDDIRRHQWIGYRNYLGQKQQVNVMTSTSNGKFGGHADEFTAILYSMTAVK